jgi:hypothetical protein
LEGYCSAYILSYFLLSDGLPYMSIYAIALGATSNQLGIINSVKIGISDFLSPFISWLIRLGDRRLSF